jgi:AraC-like DNA-binding protein
MRYGRPVDPSPAAVTHEFVWIRDGAMTARCADRLLLIPQGYGLCVPVGTDCAKHVAPGSDWDATPLRMSRPRDAPPVATVVELSPLALALALAKRSIGDDVTAEASGHIEAALPDLLLPAGDAFTIALPSDPQVRTAALAVLEDPVRHHATSRYAAMAGVTPHVLSARFRRQTGLTWAQWHFRVKMYHAVLLLGQGLSVSEVAYRVGYAAPSRFISAVRRLFGVTPMSFKGQRSSAALGVVATPRPSGEAARQG